MYRLAPLALLILAAGLIHCAPLKVLDLTNASGLIPIEDALRDLEGRAECLPAGLSAGDGLAKADVAVLDGLTDVVALGIGPDILAQFVRSGGGLMIAGLPATLSATGELLAALGEAAPADVIAADLFDDKSGYWMWTPPQGEETPDHIRHIRKTLQIDKPIKRAFIRATVDNLYWVYVNGEEVGYHWSWFDHELWDVTDALRQGGNVVAFKGRNVDGPGGFFAQVGIEYEDGTRQLIASDKTWKFHIPQEEGWNGVEFDDSSWGTAASITPISARTVLPDRPTEVNGEVAFGDSHVVFNSIAGRFGVEHCLRDLTALEGTQVLASVGDHPILLSREYGKGRAVLFNALERPGGVGEGDMADDVAANIILWLGNRSDGVRFARASYPEPVVVISPEAKVGFSLEGLTAETDGVLRATLVRDGRQVEPAMRVQLTAGTDPDSKTETSWPVTDTRAEGVYELVLEARDAQGGPVFRRDVTVQVRNALNLALSVPSNRFVTAEGLRMQFRGLVEGRLPEDSAIAAQIVDARGTQIQPLQAREDEEGIAWLYDVPNLEEGDYKLVTRVAGKAGEVLDESSLTFHVVSKLDLADFYPTTMRLSRFASLNETAIRREIDDIISHGFNTLTFSGRRLGAAPGSPYDFAEDYAQRMGMAVSYSFQGSFSGLRRDALPDVSVFSDEYKDALRGGIEKAVETCRLVPRLLNVQGYMDEPFQISGKTFDDREPARAEFKRRYDIEMPSREKAMQDPALWLKYVDFWSDCFATGWRQSYAMVKQMYPGFWVELTHDSHNTFGAAGRGFKPSWAVDDVYHWGAPFDSVNYDIYPYLSVDFRMGKFRDNPVPRIAGMHMAFAQMRNLAYTYDKKLGFWVESGWSTKLARDSKLRQHFWSPRELTWTSIAAGCDYLNTFWGIPEAPRWWETHGETMNEVKSVAPLLTRSRTVRAKAAFLFPRTQHVLLQEEYWNVMVALEAFRRAYGELDCIHEDQLAQGKLDEYGVLALFDIHLMKRASAQTIRDWCQKGGVIVADEAPATDELKRPLGVFEDVFKVSGRADVREGPHAVEGTQHKLWGLRSYEAAGAMGSELVAAGTPLVLSSEFGEGHARLLNFPVKDCYLDGLMRQNAQGDADLVPALLGGALQGAPEACVMSSNPDIEAAVRQTAEGTTVLMLINHESVYPTTRVRVPFAAAGGVMRDLITGARLEHGPHYAAELACPWGTTRTIGIFPSDPKGLVITGLPQQARQGERLEYAVAVGGDGVRGNYLLDVSVSGPDGVVRQAFSGRTCTTGAACARQIRLPINAQPGTWTIKATSLWDDSQRSARFVVVK